MLSVDEAIRDGTLPSMAEQLQPSERTARVLPFRPRLPSRARGNLSFNTPKDPQLASLNEYEGDSANDDFRHRTIVNLLAFVVIVILTTAGVWLADSLAALRKTQDCVLSGRRNCATVDLERPRVPAARDQYVKAR